MEIAMAHIESREMPEIYYNNQPNPGVNRAGSVASANNLLAVLALFSLVLVAIGIIGALFVGDRALIASLVGFLLWAGVGKVASKMDM